MLLWETVPDLSSTGGYLVGMASKEMLQGQRGCVNPLSWRSGKLPRIARSSLSAEDPKHLLKVNRN